MNSISFLPPSMWLSSSHTIISYFYSGGAPHLRRERVPQEVERRAGMTALVCSQILELRNLGVVRNAEASITNKGHSEKGSRTRKPKDLAAFFNCIFLTLKASGQSSSLSPVLAQCHVVNCSLWQENYPMEQGWFYFSAVSHSLSSSFKPPLLAENKGSSRISLKLRFSFHFFGVYLSIYFKGVPRINFPSSF